MCVPELGASCATIRAVAGLCRARQAVPCSVDHLTIRLTYFGTGESDLWWDRARPSPPSAVKK